ncbi:alpha/beta fold hydrolase [Kibdelosporangium aridum]|uniref:alpha/beta fold hydrolase n=1 Tax=Kibdelosporangium aridum TaxID=2030 RepID=UPI000A050D95|nr:alpha/beta hydrolase [Kibdelosporangium aridum]
MREETAVNVGPTGIEIAYQRFGDPADPPVLLIMGGNAQMIHWPDGFCSELIARGLHVIRFDNRDAGRSTHFRDAPVPDFAAALNGDFSSASYTLADMADDTVGLLDALDLDSAHLVGQSLGGMIAQTVAIEHPFRVRSLTSISSNTGDPKVGQADLSALASLGKPAEDREGYIDWMVKATRLTASSPGFPFDESTVRATTALAYDRGHDPGAFPRQGISVLAYGDRTEKLKHVKVPTLVLHGSADPSVEGGRATAAAIPGSKLVIFEGMGHNLPRELWCTIANHIADLVHSAEKPA